MTLSHSSKLTLSAIAIAALSACGGGADTYKRGVLIDTPVVLATLTAAQVDAGTSASGLQALSGKAKCDVKVVSLNYTTIGIDGDPSNASGVFLMPSGSCTAAAGLVACDGLAMVRRN